MEPSDGIQWLRLLQLADSALPIGGTAHSFGLETLVDSGQLTVDGLAAFLTDHLIETGTLEAVYCLAAHAIGARLPLDSSGWLELNARLDAQKMARESRVASTALGRRFLQLALDLEDRPSLEVALQSARQSVTGVHYFTAFGLVGGVLGFEAQLTAAAYLRQSLAGLVSACQRLLPLGQSAASHLLWTLQPAILETARQAASLTPDTAFTFAPQIDIGSFCHPTLATRLFIS
jgi:urease accessory protein